MYYIYTVYINILSYPGHGQVEKVKFVDLPRLNFFKLNTYHLLYHFRMYWAKLNYERHCDTYIIPISFQFTPNYLTLPLGWRQLIREKDLWLTLRG